MNNWQMFFMGLGVLFAVVCAIMALGALLLKANDIWRTPGEIDRVEGRLLHFELARKADRLEDKQTEVAREFLRFRDRVQP